MAINERKDKVPTDIEKIETRMDEIEKRNLEKKAANTKKAREEGRKRRERMKNTWTRMGWLHSFIEKNKYNWERRRVVQEKEKEQKEEYELWRNKGVEEQIADIKREENQRLELEKRKAGRNNWEVLRESDDDDEDASKENDEQSRMMMMMRDSREAKKRQQRWKDDKSRGGGLSQKDPDEGDKPGWGN